MDDVVSGTGDDLRVAGVVVLEQDELRGVAGRRLVLAPEVLGLQLLVVEAVAVSRPVEHLEAAGLLFDRRMGGGASGGTRRTAASTAGILGPAARREDRGDPAVLQDVSAA